MARKRFNFHFIMESFLTKIQSLLNSAIFMNRWYYRLLVLVFLGVFITVGIHPVLSQIPTVQPIKQELTDISKPTQDNNICYIPDEVGEVNDAKKLMEIGKNCYEQGDFNNAAIWLQNAVQLFASEKDQQINLGAALGNLSLIYQKQGKWQLAQTSIESSFDILKAQKNINDNKKQQVLAQVWNIQGKLQFAQGKVEDALKSWKEAAVIYDIIGNKYGVISSQINQVQALQALGLFQPAQTKIEEIEKKIEKVPVNLKSKVLLSLGDVLRSIGNLKGSNGKKGSEEILNDSLIEAKTTEDKNAALLSLGNTLWAKGNLERDRIAPANYEYMPWRCETKNITGTAIEEYDKAIEKYNEIISNKPSIITESKVNLNLLRLFIDKGEIPKAQNLLNKINFDNLPNSRAKIYAEINFAKSLACLQQKTPDIKPDIQLASEELVKKYDQVIKQLGKVIQAAEDLKDNRSKSYGLGNLGGLYEYFASVIQEQDKAQKRREQAKKLTEEALYLAQPGEMSDIAYQWQWQLGRLLDSEKKNNYALQEYKNAVNTLNSVRGDLLSINADVQFNFRDNVEPLYRQYINLLLQSSESSQKNLQTAIESMDYLRLAELQNFLRCDLSEQSKNKSQEIEDLDPQSAFIYTIILKDRLEIILKLPKSKLAKSEYIHKTSYIDAKKLEETIKNIQDKQNRTTGRTEVDRYGKEIYQWLIQPIELELEKLGESGKPKTLVFSLDGSLRNIALSALPDSHGQYLITKYAIATIYTKNLTKENFNSQPLDVITAGITDFSQIKLPPNLPNLDNVEDELKIVSTKINSHTLLNQDFTIQKLKNKINNTNASILHIATHGKFNSDPDKTFLVAWDGVINIKNFGEILHKKDQETKDKLKLLVLSACETAEGDRRAVLGLAGIAVQAGVNTTLASLWNVNDYAAVKFMEQFYQNLKTETNLAIALQKTQTYFLDKSKILGEEKHSQPYYWSSFTIVGNWLK